MKIDSPAKINLFLHVIGKRPNGYHDIHSLMCGLTLYDTLTLDFQASKTTVVCTHPAVPEDETNIAYRAAECFFDALGNSGGVCIDIEKRIPVAAGLGGGSSDAAATLTGLNELFGAPLAPEALHALAAEIGSDVPFFLAGSAAVCRGRGEIVEPIPFPHQLPLLLIKPGFGVPTPWAYSRWRDALEIPGISYAPQLFSWGRRQRLGAPGV